MVSSSQHGSLRVKGRALEVFKCSSQPCSSILRLWFLTVSVATDLLFFSWDHFFIAVLSWLHLTWISMSDFLPPLVCVLSYFSCVQLFAVLWTVATRHLCVWILQARILDWVAMLSSRLSSWPSDQTHVSCIFCIAGRFFNTEPPGTPPLPPQYIYIYKIIHFTMLHCQPPRYSHCCYSPWLCYSLIIYHSHLFLVLL